VCVCVIVSEELYGDIKNPYGEYLTESKPHLLGASGCINQAY
jgi:hypothetical protein